MRKENEIPQPIELKQLEISQSNFDDADLDLILIDDLNNTAFKQPSVLSSEIISDLVDCNKDFQVDQHFQEFQESQDKTTVKKT